MRYFFILLIAANSPFTLDAQSVEFDSIGFKQLEIGKIIIKSDTWIIRVDHGSFHDDYMPVNLPQSFCVNGQEVVFNGALGRIPMNAKLQGTPLKISMIRNLYHTRPDNSSGEVITGDDNNQPTSPADTLEVIDKAEGKIIKIGDSWLIEQNKGRETKRYAPDFIPEDFRVENTIVTFSAVVQKPAPGVRMMGTPIKITELMAEESVPFDASQLQEPVKEFYPFDSVGYLEPTKGVIKLIGSDPDVYIIEITLENNGITRYLPAVLPQAFQINGMEVIVSGTIGKIPANVRMMGTPLDIDEIRPAK